MAKQLEAIDFGIVCLTNDNKLKPWIMFESGALAKKLTDSRLVPILCGMGEGDLIGSPLTQFNNVKLGKEGVRKLVKTINDVMEINKREEKFVQDAFDMWWPKLEEKLPAILAHEGSKPAKKKIDVEAALEEILSLLRFMARKDTIDPATFDRYFLREAVAGKLLKGSVGRKARNAMVHKVLAPQTKSRDVLFDADELAAFYKVIDFYANEKFNKSPKEEDDDK